MMIEDALKWAEQNLLGKNGVHAVYIGRKVVNGQEVDCIKAVVPHKKPQAQLAQEGIEPIPTTIPTAQGSAFTDVEESPQYVTYELALSSVIVQANPSPHQQCYNIVPGGAQIAPKGANWVGTAGGTCIFRDKNGQDRIGVMTNRHVAQGEMYPDGQEQMQPHGSASSLPYGRLSFSPAIDFAQNGNNLLDIAFVDTSDGQGGYFSKPEQIGLGRINPVIVSPQLGMRVQKSGRTTGVVTDGKIVGINSVQYVGYGQGKTARFVNQIVIRGTSEQFSNAGDSGSWILDDQNRLVALLFAGGGQDTIASPIGPAVEKYGVRLF